MIEHGIVVSLPNNHPNILRFYDAGITKAEKEIRYYFLSEFCPSTVLKKMRETGVSGSGLTCGGMVLVKKKYFFASFDIFSPWISLSKSKKGSNSCGR